MKSVDLKETAKEIFFSALEAVAPYPAVKSEAEKIRSLYKSGEFRRLLVVGAGKASSEMARAVEDSLGDLIEAGIVITKYGHIKGRGDSKIKIFEAGHPVPDENGVRATEETVRLLKEAAEDTLVVCLLSGGGSSLLVSPSEGITLAEKQAITKALLNAGADINELNAVRKHISRVKGGRLAKTAYPARIISLIVSDVIGDRLDVIASGPTVADSTTYKDAMDVIEKYSIDAPRSVLDVIEKGIKGLIPESPKQEDEAFDMVENLIICSNRKALMRAEQKGEELGFQSEIISDALSGEAREVGRWLAAQAVSRKQRPLCLISGGETTVTVKGKGKGGRNMELALSFAMEIEGKEGITLLQAGTDGTDGPTDAAGAVVDGNTIQKARALGLNPEDYLKNNDSYNFFKATGELFITGPTATNVMDIGIILLI
jgi:glycerate-2-kinase